MYHLICVKKCVVLVDVILQNRNQTFCKKALPLNFTQKIKKIGHYYTSQFGTRSDRTIEIYG